MVVLLRGQWKRYPFVFTYLIGDFLTTVLEVEPSLRASTGTPAEKHAFAKLFWLDEWIMQVLVFLLVISLVYRATAHLQPRRTLLLLIITGSILFAGITFLILFDPHVALGKWMTPWTRDMNFFAAILDLGLWGVLIGARKKDYQVLLISGGLGIEFTAGAIGQALRQMTLSPLMVTLIGDMITLANMGFLYIWFQAFRMPGTVPSESGTAPSQSSRA